MTHTDRTPNPLRRTPARLGGSLAMLLLVGLLFATAASATFEQVDTFGDEGGDTHLEISQGAAVNVSGAGGVPAGSLYTGSARNPIGGVTQWGPKGELLVPQWSAFLGRVDGIAVDQATGNVYVLETRTQFPNQDQIEVYNADSSELITSFGEAAAFGETVSESPEKIHGDHESGIAVDDSGTVYVTDNPSTNGARVMVFEPQSPGDFSHYVYAGQGADIAVEKFSEALAIDAADNLYVVTEGGVSIEEYDFDNPNTPICRYETPGRQGGILGMTVNPIRGEVFYFSEKDNKIHQLSACSEGKFKETAKFTLTPKPTTEGIEALAFNPSLAWDAFRPAGVLYGADEGSHETEGVRHSQGYIFAAPPIFPPQVESESIAAITATTATIRAQINPKGSPTRYAFQYETEAAYQANEPSDRFAGAIEVPLGGAALGSGQEALSAAAALSGLEPDSGYRFRVIATSHCNPNAEEEVCEDIGPGRAFHTFPLEAPGLSDNRAWELVSPAQKHGGEVIPSSPNVGSCKECKPGSGGTPTGAFPRQSSADGGAVAYEGFPFSFSEGAVTFSEYISRRTEAGWQTTTLSPLLQDAPGSGNGYKAFDVSLTQGLLYQTSPSLSPEAPAEYANLYAQPTATPSMLDPLLLSEPPNRPAVGSAGSLSLTYAGATADLSRIFFAANDALTGETPFAPEAEDGGSNKNNLYEWSGGQLRLVNVLPGNTEAPPGPNGGSFGFGPASAHTISEDGTRAFWSSPTGQLYVRINGESTTAIPDPGKFLAASADGSKVLLGNGHLFDLAGEEPTVQEVADLSEGKGGFEGILGQSEDLSQIYFVDTAVLDEEENDHGAVAQLGKYNLYSWQGGTSSFVATLAAEDEGNFVGDWKSSPSIRTAEASPGGRWVAFLSKAPLSGYDNTGPCSLDFGKVIPGPCPEAFLYDSATGKLTCASCDPSGARPLGPTHLTLIAFARADVLQPRYLTDAGRLYFDTQDSLSSFDTNSGVEDVYQYEPEGVGNPPCERQAGCVSLISAGHEAVDSNFVTMDETGANVFFTTRDQLVLKDKDELIDLYDARENGGIPAESEVARSECQGEACQAAIVTPNDPTPGSSSFEGAGNVDEHKATKKHKHKKRKHAKKHKASKRAHGRANHNRGGAK